MARHNGASKVRAQYTGKLREADKDKRRKRIESRKRDRRRMVTA